MTLTIDLPETLANQFHERQIPENELKAVAVAAWEIWLAQRASKNSGRFDESAVPFARRLIAQNRELFELLAQH